MADKKKTNMPPDPEKVGAPSSYEPDANEGEGNKTADRRYRQDAERFARTNDPSELARQAVRDIENNPRSYQDAEEEGRRHLAEEDPELRK